MYKPFRIQSSRRWRHIVVATLLGSAATLAGCGGGGSSAPPTAPPAPAALRGTIDGLAQSGLILKNGTETISPAANATSFAFVTLLPYNTAYAVTVQQQPTGQTCQVENGSGQSGITIAAIVVSCAGTQWTWLSGSSSPDAGPSYGTMGVAAGSNMPGARAAAASWTDGSGKLWMFGGYGNGSTATGYLSDLWKYDPLSGLWTWMGGPSTTDVAGVYGTQGTASPSNAPGGRNYSASWIDPSGNVWIFGGAEFNSGGAVTTYLNDLWKYDPLSGNWTWVSGSNQANASGTYGVLGVGAAANVPGAREGASTWVDSAGVLWLFGGYGYDATGTLNELDDLWSFSSGQWTWVSGDNSAGAAGVYGTRGTAAPANHPGARRWSVAWRDAAGKFWLFGGDGYDAAGTPFGSLNDLWTFDPAILQWTWESGANSVDSVGVYGVKGVAAAANTPGARDEAVGWRDSTGAFWLYGGNGYDSTGARSSLNDLWKYDAATSQWTWISGSTMANAAGVYGMRGVGAASNVPGARQLAATWVDANNTLWLFGGYGYDSAGVTLHYLNDLWFVVPQ